MDEDNGVMLVTVTLTGDLKTDVTVNIATVAGTGVLQNSLYVATVCTNFSHFQL